MPIEKIVRRLELVETKVGREPWLREQTAETPARPDALKTFGFDGSDRFERPPPSLAPVPQRALQPRDLAGVPSGLAGKIVNFGGATVGVLELAGLTFHVSPYYLDVTPEIARSSRPETAETYRKWKEENGATAVLNLCAEKDFDSAAARAMGLHTKQVKIIDNTSRERIFSSRATQNAVLDHEMKDILEFVRREKKTVIHCEAGIGRTGMVVACLQMALYGKGVNEAIAEAVRVSTRYNRVKRVVMVPAQIDYIRHFAEELKAGRIEGYPVVPRARKPTTAAALYTTRAT